MFCTNCGQENKDGAKFCTGCGAPLVTGEPPVGFGPESGPRPDEGTPHRMHPGVVVAIAAMCKMSPLELVKRASVPSIIGLVAHHIFVFWLSV